MFRSFRSYIMMVGILTITVIISGITINSYTLSKQAAFSLAEKLINANAIHFIESTKVVFKQAEKDLEMLALSLNRNQETLNSSDVLNVLWRLGQLNKEYISIYLTDANGNFIQVSKEPNLRTKTINANSKNKARIIYRHPDYSIKANMEQDNSYDPLARPWYSNTGTAKKAYWTNVYKFKTNNSLGVTGTYPLIGENGDKNGVIAIDISMKGLSHLLSHQHLSKNGFAFVLDAKEQIIAMPSKLTNYDDQSDEIPTINSLGNETLSGILEQQKKLEDSNKIQIITYNNDNYFVKKVVLNIGEIKNWSLFISVSEDSVMSEVNILLSNTIILSIIFLIIGLYLMYLVAGQLSDPVHQILINSQYLRKFQFSKISPIPSRFNEIREVSEQFQEIKKTLLAYDKFVPTSLVTHLLKGKNEISLGGDNKQLTFFTTQISGFRNIASQLDSKQQANYILKFQNEISRILMHADAVIDHYSGDKIVAFWGGTNELKLMQVKACNAALACREGLKQLKRNFIEAGLPIFDYRIGLHDGEAIVGNFGSEQRMVFSAIGENVVYTQFVEAVNKETGTDILVSQAMHDFVHTQFNLRCVGYLTVDDKKQKVYALLSSAEEELTKEAVDFSDQLSSIVDMLIDNKNGEAKKLLIKLKKARPNETVITHLLDKCEE